MRHLTLGLIAASAMLIAGSASAQQAQYSSKDIIDTFAKKPAPPPAAGECEKRGMVTGDDGVCEPVKNARGFSLPTRANLKAGATAPAPHAAAVDRPVRVASTTPSRAPAVRAPTAHKDLLITFKVGSSELTDQAKANAKVFAEALNSSALADAKFDIAGYTDASGDKDKNVALSQARAAAVRDYLASQGVSPSRMAAKGFGATDFAVQANPMSPSNRRVEARRTE